MITFDILFIKLLATILIVAILSISSCSIIKADIAAKLVTDGADPLAVQCLLYGDSSGVSCIILTTKK